MEKLTQLVALAEDGIISPPPFLKAATWLSPTRSADGQPLRGRVEAPTPNTVLPQVRSHVRNNLLIAGAAISVGVTFASAAV